MIATNSGKIYRFALDHGLGYGFAEVYDFTDDSLFDGRYAYAYDRVDAAVQKEYSMRVIRSGQLALGPVTLYKFPNVRGAGAWKYLFQTDDLRLTRRPPYKVLQGLHMTSNNWADSPHWYQAPCERQMSPKNVDYEQVRHLETRILNAASGVSTKLSMKFLLDQGRNVSDFYDLDEPGPRNMFIQLINTYYPIMRTIEFLAQLPRR